MKGERKGGREGGKLMVGCLLCGHCVFVSVRGNKTGQVGGGLSALQMNR
jgi:hypothetical protein